MRYDDAQTNMMNTLKAVATSEINLYGLAGAEERPLGLKDLCIPFLKSVPFYLLVLMSIGLTFIRETFRDWSPIYLQDVLGISPSQAVILSTLHPFIGGLGVIVTHIPFFSPFFWVSTKDFFNQVFTW